MKIALAQLDCASEGELAKSFDAVRNFVDEAAELGAELTIFPELSLHGYAREGHPLAAADSRLTGLTRDGMDVLVGFREDGGIRQFNAAGYYTGGLVHHVHRKLYLPNYLVWEERKRASPGQSMQAFDTRFGRMAVLICNDAWQQVLPWLAAQDGAEVMVIPANSAAGFGPETLDVIDYWDQLLTFIARMHQSWVVFVNRVGDEDGTRFWGGSRVIDPSGQVTAQAPFWHPSLLVADIDIQQCRRRRHEIPLLAEGRLGLIEREVQRLIREGGDF
ncbi:nitrilase-related carbon-nitrogen hydrolase [Nocardia yamanashiensis]|uniref:nitrilase-related carbon-nitrogen hydrolase n=1 Tax=Nocardia yamanashiensis TaxID=209247 RepID=UPI00082AC10E|nr:nitrilase-related carbon-nitrogen hydrolase [Nocardia yamanashiensis]